MTDAIILNFVNAVNKISPLVLNKDVSVSVELINGYGMCVVDGCRWWYDDVFVVEGSAQILVAGNGERESNEWILKRFYL